MMKSGLSLSSYCSNECPSFTPAVKRHHKCDDQTGQRGRRLLIRSVRPGGAFPIPYYSAMSSLAVLQEFLLISTHALSLSLV